MTTALMEAPADNAALLRQRIRRVCFETHTFMGRRLVKGVVATINGKALDTKRVRKPPVSLLPEAMVDEINAAKAGIDRVLARAHPCRTKGTRLVSLSCCDAFVADLNAAIAAFDAMADAIAARRDAIYEHNRAFWLPHFDGDEAAFELHVASKIPPAVALRARFSVRFWLDDAAALEGEFPSDLVAAFFRDAERNRSLKDEQDLRDAVAAPSAYAAALRALRTKINEGTKVTDASLNDARTLGLRCLGTPDVIAPAVVEAIGDLDALLATCQAEARAAIAAGDSATAYFKGRRKELTARIDAAIDACDDAEAQASMLASYGVGGGVRALAFPDDYDDEDN